MSRRLPPLNSLRAFEAAARHLSFTVASEELHVTQGAVSRAVKGLEDHLGVTLFQRLPRALALTDEGKVLLAGVTEGLDRIAQAAARVEARAHDLQVKVPPTFTIRWLMRRLIRFQTSRPDIRVRLNTGWEWVDFDRDDFDAGIVFGVGPWPGLRADPLFEERLTALCAPSLLGRLKAPADLAGLTILHPDPHQSEWRAWLELAGMPDLDVDRNCQIFDTQDLAIQAAADGHGVTVADLSLVQDDIAAGRLAVPFPGLEARLGSYQLVSPKHLADRPALAAFRDWLLEEARGA
ncbi:transcriptional regulator GcvA [Skermanella mucosa]|uniref:transcriptional regulator GcvA n=1 Tax=Skermanella mucosa TaxID=1789672 RepID=UPI00192ABA3D|nr:transcriptional regulator GcvA [Skermanella mucosa]UEM21747.1 transcriptional regulator GcvA [Skermanella mucosa]